MAAVSEYRILWGVSSHEQFWGCVSSFTGVRTVCQCASRAKKKLENEAAASFSGLFLEKVFLFLWGIAKTI